MKHITIYDIAESLGVSTTTVSRALQDHHSIGKKTIKKVKLKAKEMGYHPNILASNLRRRHSNTIGVIVSYINRHFISSLISGIEEVCGKNNYNVIISQSLDKYEKEVEDVVTMFSSRVDGLIVSLAADTNDYAHFDPFLDSQHAIVFADRVSMEVDADRVLIDNYDAAYQATTHLIEQGYERIGHLAGTQHQHLYQKRLEGYKAALRESDMPYHEELTYISKLGFEDGAHGAELLLSGAKADAIFAANDRSAIGFMLKAEELGYRIPDDIGIVGFNNDPISTIVKPRLTTINHPAVEIGKKAAELVLEKIQKKDPPGISQTISFNTNLVIRESSKRF